LHIVKLLICPLLLQTPDKDSKPTVHGYIVAYKRHDLDINYSSRSLKGARTCSHVISLSRVSNTYDIMVSAYGFKEHGDFCPPVTLCLHGRYIYTSRKV